MCVRANACVQMLACAGAQFNKGNLFIKLKVKFPKIEDMEPEVFEQLSKLLPASPKVDKTEEVCPCVCARAWRGVVACQLLVTVGEGRTLVWENAL